MIQNILTILLHMIAFAIALLPLSMIVFYKRLNLGLKYDYQSMLRILPISVMLIIISAYKVIYISLFYKITSPVLNANASLFFSIAFIVCVFLSIYFVIDRATMHFDAKSKKLVLNVSAGITILLAIITIFQLISKSQENQINYIDLAMNLMFPTLTGVLTIAGIISLIFYKKISKQQKTYSLVFDCCAPFIILDMLFAEKTHVILTCIPYLIYIIIVFIEVFGSAPEVSRQENKAPSFKDEFDLTDREMEVYNLASKGMSNQEISNSLFVSIHTVKTHLQHIFSKLNINNRYQLINFKKESKNKDK